MTTDPKPGHCPECGKRGAGRLVLDLGRRVVDQRIRIRSASYLISNGMTVAALGVLSSDIAQIPTLDEARAMQEGAKGGE